MFKARGVTAIFAELSIFRISSYDERSMERDDGTRASVVMLITLPISAGIHLHWTAIGLGLTLGTVVVNKRSLHGHSKPGCVSIWAPGLP
jgi:hypothetical protein